VVEPESTNRSAPDIRTGLPIEFLRSQLGPHAAR